MRLARLSLDGREAAAIEHQGDLYQVDLLDRALGSPLPASLLPHGQSFQRRVLSMAMAGLDDHLAEILDGTRLDDCVVPAGEAELLPPCGEAAALLELRPGASLALRLEGRSLRGHQGVIFAPRGERALLVRAALAFVVTESLHLPTEAEARGALGGVAMALAWEAPALAARAERERLGPAPGRVAGTHLGPWLEVAAPGEALAAPSSLRLRSGAGALEAHFEPEAEARVARVLEQIGGHADVLAGDVVLLLAGGVLEVAPGGWASVSGPGGELRGVVG